MVRPGRLAPRTGEGRRLTLLDLTGEAVLDVVDGIPVYCDRGDPFVQNYDRIAADHLEQHAELGHNPWQPRGCEVAMTSLVAGVVRDYAPLHGGPLLDVGCGPGRLLDELLTFHGHGVDVSLDYLRVAQLRGHSVACARSEQLPYEDDSFDVVTMTDLLEHVLDLHATVSEALRVLRPDGLLVIRVPREDDLSPYLLAPYLYVHVRRFDQPTLSLLLGRVFQTTILTMFELELRIEGTLAREIVVAARNAPAPEEPAPPTEEEDEP